MHQSLHLQRRVPHGALVRLERSAAKVARCVLRGERSREAPDLPGGVMRQGFTTTEESQTLMCLFCNCSKMPGKIGKYGRQLHIFQ